MVVLCLLFLLWAMKCLACSAIQGFFSTPNQRSFCITWLYIPWFIHFVSWGFCFSYYLPFLDDCCCLGLVLDGLELVVTFRIYCVFLSLSVSFFLLVLGLGLVYALVGWVAFGGCLYLLDWVVVGLVVVLQRLQGFVSFFFLLTSGWWFGSQAWLQLLSSTEFG